MSLFTSCVKENYDACPDWGKYRVQFFDTLIRSNETLNVIVASKSQDNHLHMLGSFLKIDGTDLLQSQNVTRLLPGKYDFNTIMTADEVIKTGTSVTVRNGKPYFYSHTNDSIVKAEYNKVYLKYNLANVLLQFKCVLRSEYTARYTIVNFRITQPIDNEIYCNLTNGVMNYSASTSEFFDESNYTANDDLFYNYVVPVLKSNYINIEVTLLDNYVNTQKKLFTRIYLNTDLVQGYVYKYGLDVTPNAVNHTTSTLKNWNDYIHNTDIQLN